MNEMTPARPIYRLRRSKDSGRFARLCCRCSGWTYGGYLGADTPTGRDRFYCEDCATAAAGQQPLGGVT